MTERRPLILRADTAPPRLQELPAGDLLPTDTLGNAIKVLLQGLVTGNNAGITSTDTVLQALGKLQAQASAKVDKDGAKVLSDNNFTNAERVKLANVAENASANSSDAFLLARANHTGPLNWAWSTYGGTANAITLTPAFARAAYAAGDQFRFRATATNTGAATINVGGLGVKSAVTVTGAALPAGYIRTDVDTVCVYDGVNFVVQREIERGSNTNGEYVRWADGTQTCTKTTSVNTSVAVAAGALFFTGSAVTGGATPALFAAPPQTVLTISGNVTAIVAGFLGSGASSFGSFYHISDASRPSESYVYKFSADGRWYM